MPYPEFCIASLIIQDSLLKIRDKIFLFQSIQAFQESIIINVIR